jgi:hypothetical protein
VPHLLQYADLISWSILPLEIKLSKESGWNPNDRVNLPNDCACSKPGLAHIQNIYMLWSYMFICYLYSGDSYICYVHNLLHKMFTLPSKPKIIVFSDKASHSFMWVPNTKDISILSLFPIHQDICRWCNPELYLQSTQSHLRITLCVVVVMIIRELDLELPMQSVAITTQFWVWIPLMWSVLDTTVYDTTETLSANVKNLFQYIIISFFCKYIWNKVKLKRFKMNGLLDVA